MQNVLFYKFTDMGDLEDFKEKHLAFMFEIGVKGEVLIADEGINGNISGTQEQCEKYMEHMQADPRFAGIEFKVTPTDDHDFKKTIVRIRPEIITMRHDYDYKNTAPYIEPDELDELYASGKEFYIMDTRNDYEAEIGHFKGAIIPDMQIFSQFPDKLEEYAHLKDKLIVTYCTGGIRCEKATCVMAEKGFTNVKQLHGGIIRYGEHQGNSNWKGKCFVFDKRVDIDISGEENEPITCCELTGKPTAKYTNCKNPLCDKRFLCAEEGLEQYDGCCSSTCEEQLENSSCCIRQE